MYLDAKNESFKSNIRAPELLNLLNSLRKRNKMLGKPWIFKLFFKETIRCIGTYQYFPKEAGVVGGVDTGGIRLQSNLTPIIRKST